MERKDRTLRGIRDKWKMGKAWGEKEEKGKRKDIKRGRKVVGTEDERERERQIDR